jgi:hypothetical protein
MFYDTEISILVVMYSSNVFSSVKLTVCKRKGNGIMITKILIEIQVYAFIQRILENLRTFFMEKSCFNEILIKMKKHRYHKNIRRSIFIQNLNDEVKCIDLDDYMTLKFTSKPDRIAQKCCTPTTSTF